MLIQNSIGPGVPTRLASDSAPVVVENPDTPRVPVDSAKVTSRLHAEQKPQGEPSAAQLQDAVDSINQAMKQANSNLEFSIDRDTKKTIVKVVEAQTGTVIKQFPSEEVIAISKAIDSYQKGWLVEQKA